MNALALTHPSALVAAAAPAAHDAPGRPRIDIAIGRNPVAAPRVSLISRRRAASPLSLSWIGLAR